MSEAYKAGCGIAWVLIFVGTWIYCIASYGFLLGVGLGWLPAGIVATLTCWMWPLFILIIGGGILLLLLK